MGICNSKPSGWVAYAISFWQAYDFMKLVYCEVLCVILYITENSFNSSIENYFNAVYFLNLVHFLTFSSI